MQWMRDELEAGRGKILSYAMKDFPDLFNCSDDKVQNGCIRRAAHWLRDAMPQDRDRQYPFTMSAASLLSERGVVTKVVTRAGRG